MFRNLDLIFAAVPGKSPQNLLHSRLASIRAAFEALVRLSEDNNQPQAFEFLIKVGFTYGWLNISRDAQYLLMFAASMDLIHTLQTLLENGCRPDSRARDKTAIVVALECRNFRCAQLQFRCCDVNREIHPGGMTNFDYFLKHLDVRSQLFETGLELFIQAGADIDANALIFGCPNELGMVKLPQGSAQLDRYWSHLAYPEGFKFSALDYLFYFYRPLFDKLSSKSARLQNGRFSRVGILLASKGGRQSLEHYLDNLEPKIDQKRLKTLSEHLICEEFFLTDPRRRRKAIDMNVVHALVSLGTNVEEVLRCFPHFLQDFIEVVAVDCLEDDVEAIQYLINNGAAVDGEDIGWMALQPATRLLDLARGRVVDTNEVGIAVIPAAVSKNFEAVERLLHTRINLGVDIERGLHSRPLSIIAHVIDSWESYGRDLPTMMEFLVDKGAPLRLSAKQAQLYHLLRFTMDQEDTDNKVVLEIVQYIVEAGYDPRDPSFPSAAILESCHFHEVHGAEIFEYLFRNGAQLRPGSPMTTWIGINGDIGLVREMLEAGVDLNAYNKGTKMTALQMAASHCRADVVELLLKAGADVNARAGGQCGLAVLQASCYCQPKSSEQQKQKLRTIELLFDHGADVTSGSKGGRFSHCEIVDVPPPYGRR